VEKTQKLYKVRSGRRNLICINLYSSWVGNRVGGHIGENIAQESATLSAMKKEAADLPNSGAQPKYFVGGGGLTLTLYIIYV
jgi:hypothetical protein